MSAPTSSAGAAAGEPSWLRPQLCGTCGAVWVDELSCPDCHAPLVDPRVGSVLDGRYRVERLLGQGGMGRVYEGTRLDLGAPVAIKFLLASAAALPDARARFRREALALARLRHPGMVAVHDVGEREGSPYMVMELARGTTLHEAILVDGETMPIARVVAIADQVLAVLQAAHAIGIVHRDVKPANVMLVDAGDGEVHVKVLDFGLALLEERAGDARLTATSAVQGTSLYMSPEQCRGRDVGPATDVYAFGAMLYEMLTAEAPFTAPTLADYMAMHMFVPPPPMIERGLRRAVPPALETIAMRALAKKAEERPTATELRAMLRDALAGADARSRAERSADARASAVALGRDERALPAPRADGAATAALARPASVEIPEVVVLDADPARTDELRRLLAVAGIATTTWPPSPSGVPGELARLPAAALVAAGARAAALVEQLRADARFTRLPVLVFDVGDPTETPALIRAGASDVVLSSVGDDTIGTRLWRTMRRRR